MVPTRPALEVLRHLRSEAPGLWRGVCSDGRNLPLSITESDIRADPRNRVHQQARHARVRLELVAGRVKWFSSGYWRARPIPFVLAEDPTFRRTVQRAREHMQEVSRHGPWSI